MAREITKEDVIAHKKKAIKTIDKMFETFINNPKYLKKADLIAYWLESYSSYVRNEEKFEYARLPKYERGNVISLNLGFNVGSEQGGLHYAIVLDNYNRLASRVVTIIPLSSGTSEDTFERDVFLGNELYEKLNSKYEKNSNIIEQELAEKTKILELLKKTIAENIQEQNEELQSCINEMEKNVDYLLEKKKELINYNKNIQNLKMGSIALTGQITTVSKMRIYRPKSSNDLLYGLKFSDGAMDKINERLKELYIFSK